MNGKYERECAASKLFHTKDIAGLPDDLQLAFKEFYIRIFELEDDKNYFYCTLAIPAILDEDGYVVEIDFLDPTSVYKDDELWPVPQRDRKYDPEEDALVDASLYEPEVEFNEHLLDPYSAPLTGVAIQNLSAHMSCRFKEEQDRGQRILLLSLEVRETPFAGRAFIDKDFFNFQASPGG